MGLSLLATISEFILHLFFIFEMGASEGPKTLNLLFCENILVIYCATLRTSSRLEPLKIRRHSLENGGYCNSFLSAKLLA